LGIARRIDSDYHIIDKLSINDLRRASVLDTWAAGSAFMRTQALLSFLPDAPRNKLYIDPSLPQWPPDLAVHDIRLGKHKLDIRFWREGDLVRGRQGRSQAGSALRYGVEGRAAENRLRSGLVVIAHLLTNRPVVPHLWHYLGPIARSQRARKVLFPDV
jgi:hypothetical protein